MNIRKLTTTAVLCALAYAAAVVGRVPIVLFLKYDPKDIIIALGGFIFGPVTSFVIAFISAFAEMITVSDNGVLGLLMNVISSCSFACTAAVIHKRKPVKKRAVLGLLYGWVSMVAVMMVWNYLIAPLYMGCSKEEVASLLLPAFLPFNLIKGGLNALGTMILYKPVITALSRVGLIENR